MMSIESADAEVGAVEGLGRDTEAYSARNSSKGALIPEATAVFRALASGTPLEDVQHASLTGRLFRQKARETRRRIWQALNWRFFIWEPPAWVVADLANASLDAASDKHFVGLVYLHTVRRDRLTYDFVTRTLWTFWRSDVRAVRRSDVMDFMAEKISPNSSRWRESTRLKVAGNVLSALRDFGLLSGVQKKVLQRPYVDLAVALHLCRLLDAEGLRGRALLEAQDWRLFLWDIQDTSQALVQLAQRGDLRFERSGQTVVLDVPKHPLGGGR
jgi:hypothetical protein